MNNKVGYGGFDWIKLLNYKKTGNEFEIPSRLTKTSEFFSRLPLILKGTSTWL